MKHDYNVRKLVNIDRLWLTLPFNDGAKTSEITFGIGYHTMFRGVGMWIVFRNHFAPKRFLSSSEAIPQKQESEMMPL